ncbi:MAG: DUF397 domain-containing protein [Streptosporangiaceae bacterium]
MSTPIWRKSSYSGAQQGDCVELAKLPGSVGLRDSKHPGVGSLTLGRREFAVFLARVKNCRQ